MVSFIDSFLVISMYTCLVSTDRVLPECCKIVKYLLKVTANHSYKHLHS
ncbi:hypothetical protein [Yersinia phage vB_YenM_P778]